MNDSDRVAARQIGAPAGVVVVCEVWVGVDADVVTVTVVVGVVVAATVDERFEPPQAASTTAAHGSSRIPIRRMGWVSPVGAGLLPRVADACDHCGG